VPFEHRMQPRNVSGATVIDDTYNGNIDGMQAGLRMLKDMPGSRKIYVTPGLVDQGKETKRVHRDLGVSIAKVKPHIVVLMHNSVTKYIVGGMRAEGYKGELRVENDPLKFYTNLDNFIAAGDVVLLQNDWTDNYA
jgi:UDP-N-acetylmuramoyl-tripeptide--D-alanyl-D-alanine ligase